MLSIYKIVKNNKYLVKLKTSRPNGGGRARSQEWRVRGGGREVEGERWRGGGVEGEGWMVEGWRVRRGG